MNVDYVAHMGDDLMVVNAARVSFAKHSETFGDADDRLINYLAAHGHWTPFAHPQVTLRMKAPIFVRTQCFKHKQGFVENEVSRRYVDDEPEFFVPDAWRGKPTNGAKQGSSEETITELAHEPHEEDLWADIDVGFDPMWYIEHHHNACLNLYNWYIKSGVAPEQARMILPQSMYTQWYWTGSLAAYARFYKQRIDPHAQKEIQDLARMVGDIIQPLFPVSWAALTQ